MLKTFKEAASRPCLFYNPNVFQKIFDSSVSNSSRLTLNFSANRSQFRTFYILSNSCLFNSTHRLLATSDNYHVPIEKANEMKYFWEDYTKKLSFKRRCINRVCTVLDCCEKSAVDLINEHPILFLEDIENTLENVKLLKENGVLSATIRSNIWLLYYEHDDLYFRINSLKQWDVQSCTLNNLLSLFKLPPVDFKKVSDLFIREKDTVPYGNRIVYLAKVLNVSVEELTSQLVRHKYLLIRSIDLILDSIKSYTDFGISEKELIDDIWALRYTEPVIRRRLRIVKENNLPFLKPWYVRCSEENFEKMLEANKIEKETMHPFQTREEFLANKLGVELSAMKQVFQKNNKLYKVNVTKLAEMVDYLLEIGFRSTDICSCSHIFSFSFESIIERMNELKRLGVYPVSIWILTKKQTDYQKFIDRVQYVKSLQTKNYNNQ